jgi:phosphoserine phosphatase
VKPQTVAEVWARIEVLARAEPTGVVATDADGTLWGGDVGEDLFRAFLEHGRVEPPAVEALRRHARDHGFSDAGDGTEVASRLYAAYGEGRFPEERMCELMVWCFAGWTRAEVASFARAVVDRTDIVARRHGELRDLLGRVRDAGIEAWLVSASPVAVVIAAGASAGFDERHVVAACPRYERDVMLAEVERPIPYDVGKVTRLRERIGAGRPLLAAFGDNAFDVALLAGARVPVAVRPKPRLRARASEIAGLVQLSPDSC